MVRLRRRRLDSRNQLQVQLQTKLKDCCRRRCRRQKHLHIIIVIFLVSSTANDAALIKRKQIPESSLHLLKPIDWMRRDKMLSV